MSTINQLVRNGRVPQRRKSKAPALHQNPQQSGTVISVFVRAPKKPNSSNKHCCRVRLNNGEEITAYIPGENSILQEHARVLIHGKRTKDLVGLRYRVIRGALDYSGDNCQSPPKINGGAKKNQGRSKYGVKRWKK